MQYESFIRLVEALAKHGVRFVLIGVGAANFYARTGAEVFSTKDRDLFLPPDPQNLLTAWQTTIDVGCELWLGDEPLGKPLDLVLAEAVSARRIVTTATHPDGLIVDLTLTMAGFEFDEVWAERRPFRVLNVDVPVARLAHIVESKFRANRPKDQLFLETWRQRLHDLDLLGEDEEGA